MSSNSSSGFFYAAAAVTFVGSVATLGATGDLGTALACLGLAVVWFGAGLAASRPDADEK